MKGKPKNLVLQSTLLWVGKITHVSAGQKKRRQFINKKKNSNLTLKLTRAISYISTISINEGTFFLDIVLSNDNTFSAHLFIREQIISINLVLYGARREQPYSIITASEKVYLILRTRCSKERSH